MYAQIVRIAKNYLVAIPDRGPNRVVNPREISVVRDRPLLKLQIMPHCTSVSFSDSKKKASPNVPLLILFN